MIRIAAVADVHAGVDDVGRFRPHFAHLEENADVLLLAGDLTRCGDPSEAKVFVAELSDLTVPVIAVLGNHDHHAGKHNELSAALEESGVQVLEGDTAVVDVDGERLGVAGVKGFGGGFAGACGTEFGEDEMKAFVGHTNEVANRLEAALRSLEADWTVALMHYSPVEETLQGERCEIFPFLGSYRLAEAVDRVGADLVVHGHAHGGNEKGTTPAGHHVRNVAQPVIRRAYAVYCLGAPDNDN